MTGYICDDPLVGGCGHRFESEAVPAACPRCGESTIDTIESWEMYSSRGSFNFNFMIGGTKGSEPTQ